MKYMGSKRWMLQNGLGALLKAEATKAKRFVDLFAGSGAVASYMAKETALPVMAFDLQLFSICLSEAIIGRDTSLDAELIWKGWHEEARRTFPHVHIPKVGNMTRPEVTECRKWSGTRRAWPITHAYGGYYFSSKQATWIDVLRRVLPRDEPVRTVALAALIDAASRCAASPGHTAQPFQPTRTAKKFLKEAWNKNISTYTQQALKVLASQCAKVKGQAHVADANDAAKELQPGDLVFIDLPYSGVQYSRFYHVLETIARGTSGDVFGKGRYPAIEFRPQSKFSTKRQSLIALEELLKTVADRDVKAILTFPSHVCSNGLSGRLVKKTAARFFHIKAQTVKSKFSTLGGNSRMVEYGIGREARQTAKELILLLVPKKQIAAES